MAARTPCIVPAIAVVSCLAAAANAQLDESRGPLSGVATAVLVDGGVVPGTDAQTRVHRNGFASGPLAVLPAASNPADLRPILLANGAPAGLDVDDLSLGRDDVLWDAAGALAVPPSSWGVLSFSLRQGAVGVPGSRIAREASLGSVGAAVFTWVLPSTVLPPEVLGVTERSHSRQDLALTAAASEVDGLDFPVMLGLDQQTLGALEPGFAPLIPIPQSIYFTVSHATRHLVPAAWWGNGPVTQLRSGATILRVIRSTHGGQWSGPHVWKHYYELGLTQDEDVDGLAVDEASERILFSCVGTARDQFLVFDYGTDGGAPVPAQGQGGTPISGLVGKAVVDDVDAVCTLDPQILTNGGPPPAGDDFGNSCGAPRAGIGPWGTPRVHATAYRRYAAGQRFFDTFMVGWPPLTGPTPGIAVLFANVGNDPTLYPVGPVYLRNVADPIPGNPLTYSLAVPPALSLTGLRITFRWLAIGFAFAEFAEARPVAVWL